MKPVRDIHGEPKLRMVRVTLITRVEIKCMLCMYETVLTQGPNTILHLRNHRLHCKSIFFRENFSMNVFIFCQKQCCCETSSEKQEEHNLELFRISNICEEWKRMGTWKQISGSFRLGMIRNSVVYV